MTERCTAWDGDWPTVHTCNDPVWCAVNSMGVETEENRVDKLLTLIDEVRELCEKSKSKLAKDILAVVIP
jgi:hypothetical protein